MTAVFGSNSGNPAGNSSVNSRNGDGEEVRSAGDSACALSADVDGRGNGASNDDC